MSFTSIPEKEIISFRRKSKQYNLIQKAVTFCNYRTYYSGKLWWSTVNCTTVGWKHEFKHFLQFHPTVILVAYVNSCFIIIRQNFFPVSFSSRIS